MPDLPYRATKVDLPKEKRWVLAGAWEWEQDRITRWLKEAASANYGRLGNVESAMEAGKGLPAQIFAAFGAEFPAINPDLLIQASRGGIQEGAPKEFALKALWFIKWIAALSEIALFAFLIWIGEADAPIILMGIILAASGLSLGRGIAEFIIANEEGRGAKTLAGWLLSALGVFGCILVTWVRVQAILSLSDGDFSGVAGAAGIPVALFAVIAIFEALDMTQRHKYEVLWDQMFLTQQWYSVDQHKKNYEKGLWKTIYEDTIRSLAERLAKIPA